MESIISYLSPEQYHIIYILFVFFLCLITSLIMVNSSHNRIIVYTSSQFYGNLFLSFIIILFIIVFLGYRSDKGFVDSLSYSILYNSYENYVPINWEGEWLFVNFSYFCKEIGLSVSGYFLAIMIVYTSCMFLCSVILLQRNVWYATLIWLSSLSFYGYATNGLRNGMACSIVILAITIITKKELWKRIVAIILMVIAFGIHRSTLLPSLCCIAALFQSKTTKNAIFFWLASIPVSFLLGNIFGDMFADFGFNDRSAYLENTEIIETSEMSLNTGFRWDFLLYSSMPVLMVWYLTIKRNFNDITYNIISNTYILANAFWIIVIRAEYSNRFAYLSWFIYPLVIAYPLIRFNIWENQNRKAGIILLLYSGFTLFMSI